MGLFRRSDEVAELRRELAALTDKVKRSAQIELVDRMDHLEQKLDKLDTQLRSFAGRVWQRLVQPELKPRAPEKPLDREELRRQHLPPVQQ